MEEKARAAPYPLRMPDDLRAELEAAAAAGNRSLHSEIVARLQLSFAPEDAPDTMALQGEVIRQRERAERYKNLSEMTDHIRTLLASLLLSTLSRLPEREINEGDRATMASMAGWLSGRDHQSTAHSLLTLLDSLDDDLRDRLTDLASHLEDIGELNEAPKPITTGRMGSVNKVIIVGNLGRDPRMRTVQAFAPGAEVDTAFQPQLKHGPQPSPNARKRVPKKG